MQLTYCVLASGSSGNCLWVKGGGVELLVDAGVVARRIEQALAELGTSLRNVRAVICTHGHSDHVAGVGTLARRHHLDVFVTEETRAFLPEQTPRERVRVVPEKGTVMLDGLSIATVPTSHDAPGSVAVGVSDGRSRLAVITDLGVPTAAIIALARGAHGLVLETNHDRVMLDEGPYPAFLKARIRGRRGHLSNDQAGELLRAALAPELASLTLAHLSEHNNTVGKARRSIEGVLGAAGAGVSLAVAEQRLRTSPITLRPKGGQLALF